MTDSGSGSRRTGLPEISLLRPINALLRQRWLVLGLPVAGLFAFTGLGLLRERTYTVTASFMPQAQEMSASQLSGLAAQFGLVVPAGETGQSPAFYVDLLESRGILGQVVDTTYAVATGGDSVRATLADLYGMKGSTQELRRDAAVRRAREMISATPNLRTGVVRVSVTTRWPSLSEQVARRVLSLVNEFNLERRQSQASTERRFVESRLKEVRDELDQSEGKLQAFLQRNREFRNAPQLTFEHDRLSREVLMRQQIYTSLAQAHEKARIDEVRNTPVITVVEQPEQPVRPDPRGALKNGVLGAVLGALFAVFVAFWREFVSQSRQQDPEAFHQFLTLKALIRDELGRPWRALRS